MMNKEPIILAIESSCDDTSAAILKGKKILSNEIANQEIHSLYGGVVPELASREHSNSINFLVEKALSASKLSLNKLDAFEANLGPGLLGGLLMGST